MIEGDEVMTRLAAACPSWAAMNPVAAAAPLDGPRDYEPVAAFAHHLVDQAALSRTDEFEAVFAVVEDIVEHGDPDALSLIRTGLVEDLQNITSHRDVAVASSDFRPFLRPATADVWDELELAWISAASAPEARVRPSADEFLDLAPTERRRIQSMTRELSDGSLAAPSDVLRYEAEQYDEELGRWLQFMRVSPLVYVTLAVVIVIAVYAFVRS